MANDLNNILKIRRAFLFKNKVLVEQPSEVSADDLALSIGSMTLGFSALSNGEISTRNLGVEDTIDLRMASQASYTDSPKKTIKRDIFELGEPIY